MALEWWEYYDIKGDLKTLKSEILRLNKEMKDMREEIEKLKVKKEVTSGNM